MPHLPLINLIQYQLNTISQEKVLQFSSLSFDVSFQEIFTCLSSGGELIIMPESLRPKFLDLWQFLSDSHVTTLFLPFYALHHLAEAASYLHLWPSTLLYIITAGEQLKITPSIAELVEKLPQCQLWNQYGPSETHVVTAYTQSASSRWTSLPPIGKPLPNTSLRLLDAHLTCVPRGSVGELCIKASERAEKSQGKR